MASRMSQCPLKGPCPETCAYVLTLGKRHYRYAPSAYRVCVTSTQAWKLFGATTKPRALGCGVFACVFEHADPKKVVKITRDPSDVAGLTRGQGGPVPKLHASYKLVGRPWWITNRRTELPWQKWPDQPEAYALVVERLRTLQGLEKAKWNQRIRRMVGFQAREDQKRQIVAAGRGKTTPDAPHARATSHKTPTIGDMAKAVCPKTGPEVESCQLRIRELNKMSADLRELGVEWQDIHAGNIGVDAQGRWKAIDVGASTTTLDAEPPELAGRRRR